MQNRAFPSDFAGTVRILRAYAEPSAIFHSPRNYFAASKTRFGPPCVSRLGRRNYPPSDCSRMNREFARKEYTAKLASTAFG
jgi:hypothetical protein